MQAGTRQVVDPREIDHQAGVPGADRPRDDGVNNPGRIEPQPAGEDENEDAFPSFLHDAQGPFQIHAKPLGMPGPGTISSASPAPMRPRAANFSTPAVYVNHDADDLALVARCTAGDTDAFEALVERYHRVLFTVAVRMLGDTDDASDAAQNAFIKAYQKLGTFDRSRRFFSWIYRILVNECLNARRDRPRHEPIAADVAAADTPADLFETAQRRVRIQSAILALPMEYREVIVLRHFTGLSYEEIGQTLQVPAKTVKSRLYTARERLAAMLRGLEAQA